MLLPGALALLLEGAAQACSCLGPQGDAGKREWARNIVQGAIAVAEVELIADIDVAAMRGERYRVTRLYAGKAPTTFYLERHFRKGPSGLIQWGPDTTCDDFPGAGERRVVVLYDPRPYSGRTGCAAMRKRAAGSPPAAYEFGNTCQRLFIEQDGGLELIREEARKLRKLVD
jgi:hypothetical protein